MVDCPELLEPLLDGEERRLVEEDLPAGAGVGDNCPGQRGEAEPVGYLRTGRR